MSRSSSGNFFKNCHYGSNHYKRKGILSGIFSKIISRSISQNHNYNQQGHNYQNTNNSLISCPKCNSKILSDSKFCQECGEKIIQLNFCKQCGSEVSSNSKFCSKCGNKIIG